MTWQPIETAPDVDMDEPAFDVWAFGGRRYPKPRLVMAQGSCWRRSKAQGSDEGPTHWARPEPPEPLPAPPAERTS